MSEIASNVVHVLPAGQEFAILYQIRTMAPAGVTLAPGRYEGAYWFPDEASPGIYFADYDASWSSQKGRFEYFELERDGTGKVIKAAFDFERIETYPEYSLRGSVRYNSAVPIAP